MTPQEKIQKGYEIIEKFSENRRKLDLIIADLAIIFKQFDEWNKLDNITIKQAELGKRYLGKILMNIKEAKKLNKEEIKLREEVIDYISNQEDKYKIAAIPKIDWDLYLNTYTEHYNSVDKTIKEFKRMDDEGEEWKE